MRAIAVGEGGTLALAEVDEPRAGSGEAIVAVEAIGLNRGDLRMAQTLGAGARPGWDFAGMVAVAGRRTPPVGTRVAGLLPGMAAWAERIAAPPGMLATVPDGVSMAVAAALPSAGLTALYALEEAGSLLGRRVLVTGASGGVGHIAVQLAQAGGAAVTGLVRSEAGAALLARLGIPAIDAISAKPGYDVVLDSVGGDTLAEAVGALATGGLCIAFGVTGGRAATIDAFDLYQRRRRIAGFGLFPAIAAGRGVKAGLDRLLALVVAGRLTVEIGHEDDWSAIAAVAARLRDRRFAGKAILRVTG